MRCLVLGGAGFLGSHLSEFLLAKGHVVRVFDRDETLKLRFQNLSGKMELISGDFGLKTLVDEAMRNIDVVFHLIGTTIPKTSNEDPIFDISSNLLPTLHMLNCVRYNQIKKIIFFSSGGTVYGIPQYIPITENHPTNPICSYGIHKLAIEKYLHLYHHLYGINYSVLRISNAYGPRQRPVHGQGAIMVFLHRILHRQSIEIWGDGSIVRDYVYVGDIMEAAERVASYDGPGHIFNISSGQGFSLNQMLDHLTTIVGHKPVVNFLPSRMLDVPVNILDIARAQKLLGWQPKVSLSEGLKLTYSSLHQ
ncbi:MAG: NAD-dependent epimerase/dehydratase family protein [Syntrophales bacterium]|jgi:UDP-glucose 4-epimerase